MQKLIPSLVGSLSLVLAIAAGSSAQAEEMSLNAALRSGKVSLYINGSGVSTGDSMQIVVKRKVPETLHINLVPGTTFVSKAGNVQSMAAVGLRYEKLAGGKYRHATQIVLDSDVNRTFLVEAYCRDFSKPTPQASSSFNLSGVDPRCAAILAYGKQSGANPKVLQTAIWIDRSKVPDNRLQQSFSVSVNELKTAQDLIAAADEITATVAIERPAATPNAPAPEPVDGVFEDERMTENVALWVQRLPDIANQGAAVSRFMERLQTLPDFAGAREAIGDLASRIRAGDLLVISTDDAEVNGLVRTRKVLAKLSKGTEVTARAVGLNRVQITVDVDGKPINGWIKLADIEGGRPNTPGALGANLSALIDEANLRLEVFTKQD